MRTRVLTKKYGDFVAVGQLDLEVRPGEIFGLLG
ncbi:MAG: sodium ABC transporter ATP-binding protein, partial [Chloroflexi bacterium]|nr:sodium ABC transporter ATP-binding protein [Chloroflexota bacterium]